MPRVNIPTDDAFFERLRKTEVRLGAMERRRKDFSDVSASVFSTANQNINHDVFPWAALTFGAVEYDKEAMWNGAARIVFDRPGLYLCGLEVGWSFQSVDGFREARIHHHLTATNDDRYKGPSISAGNVGFNHLVAPVVADEGDFVRVVVYQASGVQLTALEPARLWVTRIA